MTTKKFVQTNGIRLAYEERGSGEPLVLIMGLGADGQVWDLHARSYAEKFRCFLVDNRGTGDSDKPEGPYTTSQMADDYAGLINGLGLRNVRLVGISMGGAIAQQIALRHPDLIRSMVLACTWARFDPYAAEVFENLARVRATAAPETFMQLLQLWIWTPAWTDTHLADLHAVQRDEAEAGRNGRLQPQHAFAAQASACITHDATNELQNLQLPVLLTVGTADVFTPMAYTEYLHERITGSELKLFPGWGHVHHWEDLEGFNTTTRDWLQKH